MKQIAVAVLAVALVVLGGWRQFNGVSISAEDQALCERMVKERWPGNNEAATTMLGKCASDPGLVAMMTAPAGSGAAEVASAVSATNQSDIMSTLVNAGLIGIGVGLLIGSSRMRRK